MPKTASDSMAGTAVMMGFPVEAAEDATLFNPTSSSTTSASSGYSKSLLGKSTTTNPVDPSVDQQHHHQQQQRFQDGVGTDGKSMNLDQYTASSSYRMGTGGEDSGDSSSHCSAMMSYDDLAITTQQSSSSGDDTASLVQQHLTARATACGAMLVGFKGQAMESAVAIATAAVESSDFPPSAAYHRYDGHAQSEGVDPSAIKESISAEVKETNHENGAGKTTSHNVVARTEKSKPKPHETSSSNFSKNVASNETHNSAGPAKNVTSREVQTGPELIRSQLICDRYGFIIGETVAHSGSQNPSVPNFRPESAGKKKIIQPNSTHRDTNTSNDEDGLHEQGSFPDEATIGTTLTAATAAARSWFGVATSGPPEFRQTQQQHQSTSTPAMTVLEGSQAETQRIRERQGADIPASEKEYRLKKESKRSLKWELMLKHWSRFFDSQNKLCSRKLRNRIRKGVPHDYRGQVWPLLADVPSKLKDKPKTYKDLVWSTEIPSQEIRDTIERDIHRTFPRHILFFEDDEEYMNASGNGRAKSLVKAARISANGGGTWEQFESYTKDFVKTQIFACGNDDAILQEEIMKKTAAARDGLTSTDANGVQLAERDLLLSKGGQASLRRVLRAYSLYDSDTGYCQGMNFIAATFITLMSEEEAFWLLVAIMNEKPALLRGLYGVNMDQTVEILYVSECLVGDILPDLKKHFTKEGVALNMFATQWMVTVFTSSFPFAFVLRVWDVLLVEGYKIVYRVMLALLKVSKEKLLKMHLEQILGYLKSLPGTVDDVLIMKEAFSIPLSRQKIKKYQKQWKRMGRAEA